MDIIIYEHFNQMLTKRVDFEELLFDIEQLKPVLNETMLIASYSAKTKCKFLEPKTRSMMRYVGELKIVPEYYYFSLTKFKLYRHKFSQT